MALAMAAAGCAFGGGRLYSWVRWLFPAQIVTVIGHVGWSMFGLNEGLFYPTSMVWVVGAPLSFVLLAVLFQSAE